MSAAILCLWNIIASQRDRPIAATYSSNEERSVLHTRNGNAPIRFRMQLHQSTESALSSVQWGVSENTFSG